MGIGGTPEGVLSASALKCVGGALQGKLWPRDDEERQQLIDAGFDLDRVLTTDDLVGGDDVFFAATGVTTGALLRGVRYTPDGAVTDSIVMRSRSGTVRRIEAFHSFGKLEALSGGRYAPLAEGDEEPVDLRVAQAQDHRARPRGRFRSPGVVRDDEILARLARPQDHDLVVRRLLRIGLLDRRLAPERPDRNALERELRVLGELLEHAREIAGAHALVEALDVRLEDFLVKRLPPSPTRARTSPSARRR